MRSDSERGGKVWGSKDKTLGKLWRRHILQAHEKDG